MIEMGIRPYVHKYFYYGAQVSTGLLCFASVPSALCFPPLSPFFTSFRSSLLLCGHFALALLPAPGLCLCLCLCSFEIIRLVFASYRVTGVAGVVLRGTSTSQRFGLGVVWVPRESNHS